MENISFFSEDVEFEIKNSNKHVNWINSLIQSYEKVEGDISYIFCSDIYLLTLNQEHLNHNTLTDIITFDYSKTGIISGDIFISIDRVIENSKTFNVPFDNELKRVMAHGVLHLIGFKDKTGGDKKEMRSAEEKAILLFAAL